MTERLDAQFAFLNEADRLKSVLRANVLMDGSRAENSAEHSWHVALWAVAFEGFAPKDSSLHRVVSMLLLHDLVEVDAGDHPIHLPNTGQDAAEAAAAQRLFGLLPPRQGSTLLALWQEFEAGQSPDAAWAKTLDHCHPLFQVLCATAPRPDHVQIVADNLARGRASDLARRWPEAHAAAVSRLCDITPQLSDFERIIRFLVEADALKSVNRATTLCDGSRRENSAEHSWHIALYALILADQSAPGVDIATSIRMLLIHDLVEIDVGDVPIHSSGGDAHSSAAVQSAEAEAGNRIFGLLPNVLGGNLQALWQEFEANLSPSAKFAKSLDRVQPVMQNIQCGGGSWIEYSVTFEQLDARVGGKVATGAPELWHYTRARCLTFFP